MMLVQEFLERSADRAPGKIALICDGKRLTYADFEAQADYLAHALTAHGIERGKRVALYLPNSVELVVAIFAVLKADGIFVVINHSTKYQKLAYVLNECQASALVAPGRKADWAERLSEEVPSLKATVLAGRWLEGNRDSVSFEAVQETYSPERPPTVNIDRDLACLICTSSSTGDPKRLMSDHSYVVFAAGLIIEYLENVEDDIVINALPLSFDHDLYQLLIVFMFGGTLVLERGFACPIAHTQARGGGTRHGLPRRAQYLRHAVADGPQHVRSVEPAISDEHGCRAAAQPHRSDSRAVSRGDPLIDVRPD